MKQKRIPGAYYFHEKGVQLLCRVGQRMSTRRVEYFWLETVGITVDYVVRNHLEIRILE